MLLITGRFLVKAIAVGRKLLKSFRIPKHSTIMPIKVHRIRMRNNPANMKREPKILRWLKKKFVVRENPRIMKMPARNSRFPNASKALSNSITTPRIRKKKPNETAPIPIFWRSEIPIKSPNIPIHYKS